MITIIYAPPRTGKTSLLAHILRYYAFNKERIKRMQRELQEKNANGFNLTIPQHCVASNFDCTFHKLRCSPRKSRRINPYRLGYENPYVATHFTLPYEVIGITEGQKYFNSRMAMYYPDWQSRWMEQHGHQHIDIFIDTHRPMLIDPNVRDLANFIEVMNLKLKYDNYGKVCKAVWTIRYLDSSATWEKYISSGKTDKKLYTEMKVTADYNIFATYNSFECKPKFYDGHFNNDFDLNYSKPIENSLDGYVKYLRENDDELPDKFYLKRSEKNG